MQYGISAVFQRSFGFNLREQLEQRCSLRPAYREREQLPVEREPEHWCAACL